MKAHWKTKTYRAWIEMKARCRGKDASCKKHYTDRGITVCERWAHDYPAFLADMGNRPKGKSIERIDNEKGYEPGNCRWATQAEQLRNTRRTLRVICDGKEMCLKDACAAKGVNYDLVRWRIRAGDAPQVALDGAHIPRPPRTPTFTSEQIAKRNAAIRRAYKDPKVRQRVSKGTRRGIAAAKQSTVIL